MLSPADAGVVRRDGDIVGLAALLDPDEFTIMLQGAFPRSEFGDARPVYVRYKPGKWCLVAYRVPLDGQETDVYAMALRQDALGELGEIRRRWRVPGGDGQGVAVREDRVCAIYLFPNDNKLDGLPGFASRDTRISLLMELLPDHPYLWKGRLERINYKPERRFVARLLTAGQPRAVLKAYLRPDYLAAERNTSAIRPRGVLRVAERLGQSERHNILVLGWQDGRLLRETLRLPEIELAPFRVAGAALAELHTQIVAGLRLLTRQEEAASLASMGAGVGRVSPDLAERTGTLAGRLGACLMAEPPLARPIHGDFYAKQVLVGNDGAAILDMDRAAFGDPSLDLGLFVAHLEREILRGGLPADRLEPIRKALLEGYLDVAHDYDPARVVLYTAVGLLRLAPNPFRHRQQDWPRATEAILGRAEAIAETVTEGNCAVTG